MTFRRLAAAALVVLAAACADQAPTPPLAPFVGTPARAGVCPPADQVRNHLNALFPSGSLRTGANQRLDLILSRLQAGKLVSAQEQMFMLIGFTLHWYNQGSLTGGKSIETRTELVTFIDALYCLVSLSPPNLSPDALLDDALVAVVGPTTPRTVVTTATEQAGIDIPAGAVPTLTTIVATRLPDFPLPLNTTLDQYTAFYEFKAYPDVEFTQDVVVGACQVQTFGAPEYGRLKLAHNVGNGIELLPRVEAPFLDCSNLIGAAPIAPGWLGLAQRGWRAVAPVANVLLLPDELHASALGTCCLGGSTKTFSPFGAVDTLATMTHQTDLTFHIARNTAVPASHLPTVQILTPAGNPVSGLTVTFAVPAGSQGSITGAVQITDAQGIATLGSWTTGPGELPNVVTATATPFPGSGVANSPIEFRAVID